MNEEKMLEAGFKEDFACAAAAHKIKAFCFILYKKLYHTERELKQCKDDYQLMSDRVQLSLYDTKLLVDALVIAAKDYVNQNGSKPLWWTNHVTDFFRIFSKLDGDESTLKDDDNA